MSNKTAVFPLTGETRPDQAPVGLEDLLRRQPGVREVAIDPIGQVVSLHFDDAETDIRRIREQLAQHGYPIGTPITVSEQR